MSELGLKDGDLFVDRDGDLWRYEKGWFRTALPNMPTLSAERVAEKYGPLVRVKVVPLHE